MALDVGSIGLRVACVFIREKILEGRRIARHDSEQRPAARRFQRASLPELSSSSGLPSIAVQVPHEDVAAQTIGPASRPANTNDASAALLSAAITTAIGSAVPAPITPTSGAAAAPMTYWPRP